MSPARAGHLSGVERAKALMTEAMETLYASLDPAIAEGTISREILAELDKASSIVAKFTGWQQTQDHRRFIQEHFPTLSPRQVLVADLMAQGLTDREIALRIGVAWNTARNHATAVLEKTGTHSRRALERVVAFG